LRLVTAQRRQHALKLQVLCPGTGGHHEKGNHAPRETVGV